MVMTPRVMLSMVVMSLVAAAEWNYQNQSQWGGFCNTGSRQSPLNFKTVVTSSFPHFVFENYGLIHTLPEIENYHLKVNLEPEAHKRPYILGGGLVGKYVLDSFHFHWGSRNSIGSEHRLRDCSFAGEMHFVHFKEEYGSVTEARKHQDGVAVLAVWLEADDDDDAFVLPESPPIIPKLSQDQDYYSPTPGLLELLPRETFTKGSRGRIFLRGILPRNVHSFYRYKGSLTTPPCSETVAWTVFRETVYAPRQLLHFLRYLRNPSGHRRGSSGRLSNNFRNIQDQGDRTVYFSDRPARHFAQCNNELDK